MALNILHVAYPHHRFNTPGKIEFYSARAAAAWLPPLPMHEAPAVSAYSLALCASGRPV